MLAQVTILNELHHHMQMIRRLKRVIELETEWMVELPHDLSLGHRVLNLLVLDQLRLRHGLERENLLLRLAWYFNLEYFAK